MPSAHDAVLGSMDLNGYELAWDESLVVDTSGLEARSRLGVPYPDRVNHPRQPIASTPVVALVQHLIFDSKRWVFVGVLLLVSLWRTGIWGRPDNLRYAWSP